MRPDDASGDDFNNEFVNFLKNKSNLDQYVAAHRDIARAASVMHLTMVEEGVAPKESAVITGTYFGVLFSNLGKGKS